MQNKSPARESSPVPAKRKHALDQDSFMTQVIWSDMKRVHGCSLHAKPSIKWRWNAVTQPLNIYCMCVHISYAHMICASFTENMINVLSPTAYHTGYLYPTSHQQLGAQAPSGPNNLRFAVHSSGPKRLVICKESVTTKQAGFCVDENFFRHCIHHIITAAVHCDLYVWRSPSLYPQIHLYCHACSCLQLKWTSDSTYTNLWFKSPCCDVFTIKVCHCVGDLLKNKYLLSVHIPHTNQLEASPIITLSQNRQPILHFKSKSPVTSSILQLPAQCHPLQPRARGGAWAGRFWIHVEHDEGG